MQDINHNRNVFPCAKFNNDYCNPIDYIADFDDRGGRHRENGEKR